MQEECFKQGDSTANLSSFFNRAQGSAVQSLSQQPTDHGCVCAEIQEGKRQIFTFSL